MSGGYAIGSSAKLDHPDGREAVCRNGLALVKEWICTSDKNDEAWTLKLQNLFNESFEHFMQAFERREWTDSTTGQTRSLNGLTDRQEKWVREIRRIKDVFFD